MVTIEGNFPGTEGGLWNPLDGKMFSDRNFEYQTRAVPARSREEEAFSSPRGYRSDRFFDEETFRSERSSAAPRTVLRFPDCGWDRREEPVSRIPAAEPARKRRFSFFRFAFRLSALALLWAFGLAVGLWAPRDLLFKRGETVSGPQNEGAYVVEEERTPAALTEEAAPAAPPAAAPAFQEPKKAVAAAEERGGTQKELWPVEVLDSIASIPPWDPNGTLPPYTDGETRKGEPSVEPFKTAESFDPAGVNVGAAPLRDPALVPFAPAGEEVLAESAPAAPESLFDLNGGLDPVSEPVETAAAKPMKNQIEYFEPFDTAPAGTEQGETLRVTASEDFFADAYGVDSFSDYIPPQRSDAAKPMLEQNR